MACGRNHRHLGSYPEARNAFEAALDRRPNDTVVREALDEFSETIDKER